MLATLLTAAFLATAVLALATIAASLAKGFAAATELRRQIALCADAQTVTIRHERTVRVRAVPTVRAARRPVRQQPGLAVPAPRRAAA